MKDSFQLTVWAGVVLRSGHVSVAKDCGVGSTQASTGAWSSIELQLFLCRGKINFGGLTFTFM